MSNTKKKTILFLLHLPPPIHGSSMVGEYIRKSSLINSSFSCRFINLLASKDISDSGSFSFEKVFNFIFILFNLLRVLLRQRPSLCYFALTVVGFAFYRDVLLVLLLRVFGVKSVYHLHNKGVLKASENRVNNWLYNFVFKKSEVILLSSYLYYDIEPFVDKRNVHICPNGIPNINTKGRKLSNTLIKNENTFTILFLSNLIESKGIYILLEALALLNEKGLKFICNIVGGEGDILKSDLDLKVCKLGLEDKVFYLGKKYGKEKEDIFNSADVFAFPTFYSNECFPLVLLEALQFGLPIISTTEGGILDILEDGITGLTVQKRSHIDLANKLERLIKDSELRKSMGEKGYCKFNKNYTLDVFERKLQSIFNSIIYKY